MTEFSSTLFALARCMFTANWATRDAAGSGDFDTGRVFKFDDPPPAAHLTHSGIYDSDIFGDLALIRMFIQFDVGSFPSAAAISLAIHSGFEYNGFDGSIVSEYMLVSAHHVELDMSTLPTLAIFTVSADLDDAWTQLTSIPWEQASDDTLMPGPFSVPPWSPVLNAAGLMSAQAAINAGRPLKFAVISRQDFNGTGPTISAFLGEFLPDSQVVLEGQAPPPVPVGPINRTIYSDWTGSAPTSDNRNWCPEWTTPASSMCLSRRSDGSLAILFGTNDGSGRILRLDASTHNDDGEAIDAMYQTAYVGGSSGRNTYQYLTSSVAGNGPLDMSAIYPDGISLKALKTRDLQLLPQNDQEWSGLRILSERVAWRFGTFAVDAWFRLRKLVGYARPAPWSRTLGNPS